ncbi:hypothetical protein C0991_006050 [Blastosporella zonata]|nr:hypothetical protein C0991_006050 [Blastosporella zonata]
MTALPSRIPLTGSLSLHVPSIPKINKAQFISSYLQEQTLHSKVYAAQGRTLEISWNREDTSETSKPNTEDAEKQARPHSKLPTVDYGFGTPVLKPRVAIRPTEKQSTKEKKATATCKGPASNKVVPKPDEEPEPVRKRTRSDCVDKKISSKAHSRQTQGRTKDDSDSRLEKEHENRLKERRDRKRAKRAIMKPISNNGSQDESTIQKDQKKEKTKKDCKIKRSAGLALMHGFTATNVGSRFVKLKPALNFGVFNKGKASAKSWPSDRGKLRNQKGGTLECFVRVQPITSSAAGHSVSGFTENEFLNKTRKSPRKFQAKPKRPELSSHSASSSESDIHSKYAKDSLGRLARNKAQRTPDSPGLQKRIASSIADDTKEATTPDNKGCAGSNGCAGSIVWDIELDDVTLPSQPHSEKMPSVLVNTQNTLWGNSTHRPEAQVVATPVRSPGSRELRRSDIAGTNTERRGSSSLGPSESASRCRHLFASHHYTLETEAVSKYFASLPQPQISPGGRSPLKSNPAVLESRRSEIIIEGPACDITPAVFENHKSDPMTILSEPLGLDHSEPQQCKPYASFVQDAEYLPFVNPQDYQYSDYAATKLWSPEDYYERIPPDAMAEYGGGSCNEYDEQLYNNTATLSFYPWHELEGSDEHEHEIDMQPIEYEEGYYMQDESLDGDEDQYNDGYDSPEYEENRSIGSWIASPIHDNNSFSGNYAGNFGDAWDEPSSSGDLDGSDEPDLTGRFTEGKALLLRCYEDKGRTYAPARPSYQPQVSLAEADVAKRLRNHWLPQRL